MRSPSIRPISLSLDAARAGALSRRDSTVSQSARGPTCDFAFGAANRLTTVNPGATYWMSGGDTHNFRGSLSNYGTIIASRIDHLKPNPYAGSQTADFVGSDSRNGNLVNNIGALISLNNYGSDSAPTLRLFCGRGDTGGSTYQLYCDLDCYNYGVIDFEQYNNDNLGASFVWRNDVIGSNAPNNVYNNGAFRLANVVHHNVQNVYHGCCWVIGEGGVLYSEDTMGAFQNPDKGLSFPNQRIYFPDSARPAGCLQTIHMDIAVYSKYATAQPETMAVVPETMEMGDT